MASKGGIRRAPYGASAVSGTKADQGAEYGAGKVARMRPSHDRHEASEITTRQGGIATGRQANLTARQQRTALMFGIG